MCLVETLNNKWTLSPTNLGIDTWKASCGTGPCKCYTLKGNFGTSWARNVQYARHINHVTVVVLHERFVSGILLIRQAISHSKIKHIVGKQVDTLR